MIGATTNLGANADNTNEQSLSHKSNLKCTSCQVYFENGDDQRMHSKGPWHVYNVKRRIASLPPISFETFQTEIQGKDLNDTTSPRSESSSSDEDSLDPSTQEAASPFDCLFCPRTFPSNDDGLLENLSHMQKSHGTFIPSPETITDLETFLGYLATEVRIWHECLYCGATKPSTLSVQSHMRDKQHCTLNLEREPELLDFWDSPPQGTIDCGAERPTSSSDTERRIGEGKRITSRHNSNTPSFKKPTSSKRRPLLSSPKALPSTSEDADSSAQAPPPPPARQQNSRQLARREELSIQGLSSHQRQALVLAEKKAQRSEDVARRAREWASAKGANTQKFDQLDNTKVGKRGKQDHRLMPR
ncbi:hypothetical protein DM02DRAFT_600507 [Periconia macrospinosa]|uniref:ZN622/Rei1/Reh1 zinc finger C2H2-type domain-containing protein n=1 Tax=Periconia macrospinosa TaxID=97972 RepID=A0A2V1DBY9_9PLEO|nr:hypothetical protein DM02DRAFT_600507 [Periconia macrospinosa]